MLPTATLAKLLREIAPEQESARHGGLQVPIAEQKDWFERLIVRLQAIPRVSCRLSDQRNVDLPLHLSILISGVLEKRNPNDWFNLQFLSGDNLHGLHLLDANYARSKKLLPVSIGSIEQVEKFIGLVQASQDRAHLRAKKTEKLVGFQKLGLTAKLRELGIQHNFAFALNESSRDIKLSIRLVGRKTGFHFTFVKTKLESMLRELPELVKMLERIQSLGIHFSKASRPSRRNGYAQIEWIEPDSDRPEE